MKIPILMMILLFTQLAWGQRGNSSYSNLSLQDSVSYVKNLMRVQQAIKKAIAGKEDLLCLNSLPVSAPCVDSIRNVYAGSFVTEDSVIVKVQFGVSKRNPRILSVIEIAEYKNKRRTHFCAIDMKGHFLNVGESNLPNPLGDEAVEYYQHTPSRTMKKLVSLLK